MTAKTSTLSTAEDRGNTLQTAEALMVLAGAALAPSNIDGAHFVTLPPGYTHHNVSESVEKVQYAPRRKKGVVRLGNVASLLAYCTDQMEQANGYIYADPDAQTITAVFNDQRFTGLPGWRDHQAIFRAERTPEFDNWLRNNKVAKTQTEFAEFIEDNFADLQGEDAALLLNVATTIQATTGINFASARRLQDGQTQLTYNENIDAKAGADGALKIPQTFALGLRIFKNGGGYKLTARLKYRLTQGSVKFWYELERPERAIEDAFNGYVAEVTEKSGYAVLIGEA